MKLCLVCHLNFPDEQETCPKDNMNLVPIAEDPLIGSVIQDRYKIESIIGKGSMGIVYKASQELIGREVAIKVLHAHLVSDGESLKRFHQQARAASRLNHPHIITLYDYGVLGSGQPYIVMDLLKGSTLATLLEERDYLPVEEALPIFKQVCDALADAHKHGVVHRDVKPENIVIEDSPAQKSSVKVVDFGIAKLIQGTDETVPRITRTGTVCGSPAYMSPEQFQGIDVDHRSDIYSLGIVLYETLTGRLPFTAPDLITLMGQHVGEPAPKLRAVRPDLDFRPALEKMVDRSLAKDPENRQKSMDDFYDELQTAASDKKTTQRIPTAAAISGTSAPSSVAEAQAPPVVDDPIQEVIASRLQKLEDQRQTAAKAPSNVPDHGSKKLPKGRANISIWVRFIGFIQSIFLMH
jgi:serine/threonine-protein kinase